MGKGRAPCCDKSKVKKGPWSCEEDLRLITFIQKHGHQNWRSLPKQAGLLRCGKSCRLRWINYLRPDVKRGNFTPQEEDTILKLHQSFGNKWSKIASHLPGRTDNEIKNVWNTHLKKRLHSTEAKLDDSHAINKGGELKNVNMVVNEKEEEKKCCSSYNNASSSVEISSPNINVELRRVHADDDGVIEIPLECDDVDIWDMLDIMDPQPPNADDHSNNNDASQPVCEGLSEFECQKWFTYFENELLGV